MILLRTLLFAILCFPLFSIAQNPNVYIDTLYVTSPPANVCSPITVTIDGVNNMAFPLDNISTNISGNDVTINITYFNTTASAVISPFTHDVSLGILPLGSYNIIVNGIHGNNLTNTYYDTIAVGPSNLNASFTHPPSICLGEEIQLTNTSTGGVSNLWYEDGIPASMLVDHSLTPTSAGSVTIRLRIVNGNCQHAMQVDIPIHDAPAIDNFTLSDSIICLGETVDLEASSSGDTSSAWYENGLVLSNLDSFMHTPNSDGTWEYMYLVSNSNCSDSMIAEVSVNPLPIIDLGQDTNDCYGPIEFDAGTGFTYLWQDQSTNQTLIPSNTGIYAVTVTDSNGCTNNDDILFQSCVSLNEEISLPISVYPNPTSSFTHIAIPGYSGNVDIALFDLNGKRIKIQSMHNTEFFNVDLSDLQPGIYQMQIMVNHQLKRISLIKE